MLGVWGTHTHTFTAKTKVLDYLAIFRKEKKSPLSPLNTSHKILLICTKCMVLSMYQTLLQSLNFFQTELAKNMHFFNLAILTLNCCGLAQRSRSSITMTSWSPKRPSLLYNTDQQYSVKVYFKVIKNSMNRLIMNSILATNYTLPLPVCWPYGKTNIDRHIRLVAVWSVMQVKNRKKHLWVKTRSKPFQEVCLSTSLNVT